MNMRCDLRHLQQHLGLGRALECVCARLDCAGAAGVSVVALVLRHKLSNINQQARDLGV